MKSIYTKCKKTSNLIKVISSHNIGPGIKSQQVKITICQSVPKTFGVIPKVCSLKREGGSLKSEQRQTVKGGS